MNWNAQIISRKTHDGYNNQSSVQTVASKITDAVNSGASILNCSWASTSESQTIHMAFEYAYKMDRLSVVAMGNGGGGTPNYPAAYGSGVVSVGATQDNDTWATYSNTGAWIDVVAPGGTHISGPYDQHDIWSTMTNDSYGYDCGTSMATPVVTGVASLLTGYNTSLSNDDVEHIIRLSADKVHPESYVYDSDGWNIQMGYGRVNARRALDLIRSPYIVNHYSASGGTDFSSSGVYSMAIFGANGLADGAYQVRRHEVRRGVTFSAADQIHVWGRGVYSTGWRDEGNVNYSVGWCDVVPGTVTSNSATLRTYVYEVWTIQGLPRDGTQQVHRTRFSLTPFTVFRYQHSRLPCQALQGSQ